MTGRFILICLLTATIFNSAPSAFAQDKSPIPSDEEQAKALALIKEVYGQEWEKAETPRQKHALATKLLQKARESTDDTNRYVLFKVARDVAAQAGDAELAFKAIDAMASRYDVEAYKMKGAALSRAAKSASSSAQSVAVAKLSLQLVDEAAEKDDFVAAKYLGTLALDAARKGRDGQLVKRVVARDKEVEGIAEVYAGIKDALLRLKDSPVDPAANLAVGRYYCFFKGNWDRGLSMLALGSDEQLKKLAMKELEGVSGADEQVALGDGWWDAASASEGMAKEQLQGRAAFGYRKALPELTGLVKDRVEKRLEEVGDSPTAFHRGSPKPISPRLVSVKRIWSPGKFCAYTDLVRFGDLWICVFREATGHYDPNGIVRVIQSSDGESWRNAGLIRVSGFDLRDPKICVMPDNRLMFMGAAAKRAGKKTAAVRCVTAFSSDGQEWSVPRTIMDDGHLLWRPAWTRNTCYAVGIFVLHPTRYLRLYRTRDGLRFDTLVPTLHSAGSPSETALSFDEHGSAICVVRRDSGDRTALLGRSRPPFVKWSWDSLGQRVASPCLVRLPEGRLIFGGRLYDPSEHTGLCWLDVEKATLAECIALPSGGNTGYPGMVLADKHLWISYHSSHEGTASIYLAKVKLYE